MDSLELDVRNAAVRYAAEPGEDREPLNAREFLGRIFCELHHRTLLSSCQLRRMLVGVPAAPLSRLTRPCRQKQPSRRRAARLRCAPSLRQLFTADEPSAEVGKRARQSKRHGVLLQKPRDPRQGPAVEPISLRRA